MDGTRAKGGGALSAVATTEGPIIFVGTGEHMDQFVPFDAKHFVDHLLGGGDWHGPVHKLVNAADDDDHAELDLPRFDRGFTLRAMHKVYQYLLRMGPFNDLALLLPAHKELSTKFSALGSAAIQVHDHHDSMTAVELDSTDISKLLLLQSSRIQRIARGSVLCRTCWKSSSNSANSSNPVRKEAITYWPSTWPCLAEIKETCHRGHGTQTIVHCLEAYFVVAVDRS
ncbi:hypothetical protein GOP47_0002484 [Adiantum capillus-veneris]|uniref:SRP54-type proteins GTP-binding domain-containing protein n=1 Tax=Adiantum capillus-veneris TaxID=13818 RepID=A0A9D4VA68_ADICA|nr:hypothetical protein GOP47_0002484 [Adiantum capillus-veneris]